MYSKNTGNKCTVKTTINYFNFYNKKPKNCLAIIKIDCLSDDSSSNWLHFPSGNHLRRLNLSPASNSETETDEDIHSPRVRRRRRRRFVFPDDF